jgi:uncharacterized protein YbaP (TraB family)
MNTIGRLAASLLLILIAGGTDAAEDRAFFWRADSASATVYLLGSIHYADPSFYPLRANIERAFDEAEHLVLEIDIDAAAAKQYQELLRRKGMYSGDETLRDNVSEKTWQQLQQLLPRLGMTTQLIEKQKPGVLVLTLSTVQVMKMGYLPEMGIDQYFLNKARSHKDIISLETIEQQLDVFLNMQDGDLLLQETLYSLDEADSMMTDMVRFWKRGDEQGMQRLLFDDALREYPEFTNIYDSLIYKRNELMVDKIEQFLNGKGSYFVVVGAGHLVGDKGIVNSLKRSGYDVDRL